MFTCPLSRNDFLKVSYEQFYIFPIHKATRVIFPRSYVLDIVEILLNCPQFVVAQILEGPSQVRFKKPSVWKQSSFKEVLQQLLELISDGQSAKHSAKSVKMFASNSFVSAWQIFSRSCHLQLQISCSPFALKQFLEDDLHGTVSKASSTQAADCSKTCS